MEAMKEALKRRKGRGLDVTIILGGGAPDGELAAEKETDLAPKGEPLEIEEIAQEEQKPELEIEPMDTDDNEIEGMNMSPEEMARTEEAEAGGRKLSLGERAKLMMAKRKMK